MCAVSVIVPVYNMTKYLNYCIESLVKQTFCDIEIILVDDGSTDGSSEICDAWAIKDTRVKVIHQKNQGVSVARNNGLMIATGEWIAFVDGDDYAAENMIEKLYEETRKSEKIDLVIGSYFSEINGKISREHFFKENKIFSFEQKEILVKMAVGIDIFELKGKTNIGVPWSKLYRKRTIDGVIFQSGLKRMQDMVFNISIFDITNEIKYIDIPLYYYRINDESAVRRYSEDFEHIAEEVITALTRQIYRYNNISDKEEIIQYKKMSLLIETIRLSYINKECKLSLREKLENIERLCKSSLYYNAIYGVSGVYLNFRYKILKRVLELKLYYIAYMIIYIKHFWVDNELW